MTDFSERWEALKAALAENNMSGPLGLAGPFGRTTAAVCLTCGAAILLEDPMLADDGETIERGVYLHAKWHNAEESA